MKIGKSLIAMGVAVVMCMSSGQALASEKPNGEQLVIASEELHAEQQMQAEKELLAGDSGIEDFVTRLYEICLDRFPDEEGLNTWVSQLTSGEISGAEAAYGFLFSEEFKGKQPCTQSYVECLYRCFMGREADDDGKQFWMNYLGAGHTRGEVFNGFSQSVEFAGICEEYGITVGTADYSEVDYETSGRCQICFPSDILHKNFVSRFYSVCLDREPDEAGLASWVECIKQGMTGVEVASGFVFSEEFKGMNLCDEHFVKYMYKAFFMREADAEGLATWVNLLANGGTKGEVFNGFVQSREFEVLCSSNDISLGSADYSTVDFEPEERCSVCPPPDYSTPWVYTEDGMSRTKTISDGSEVTEYKYVVEGQEIWGYYHEEYAEEFFDMVQKQRCYGSSFTVGEQGMAISIANSPPLVESSELKELADYRAAANVLGFGSEGFEVVIAGGITPIEAYEYMWEFNENAVNAIGNPDFIYGACSNFWYDSDGTGENLYPFWIMELDLYHVEYEGEDYPQYMHAWTIAGETDGHTNYRCCTHDYYYCNLRMEWDSELEAYVFVLPEQHATLEE